MQKIVNTIVLILFLAASHCLANTQVRLMGGNAIWPQLSDLDALKPYARTLHAIDPNFKQDGITAFTGIGIKKLFDLAEISYEKGITIIGADQYVGFLSGEQVSQDLPFLAWQMNDQPIGQLKGGPFKIIFPDQAKVHGSCYTWYVDTLIAGPVDQAVLTVQVEGKDAVYTREDLIPHAEKLDPRMFSTPQGCRNAFQDPQPGNPIYAVPLSQLITPAVLKTAHHITLVPFVGSPMILKPAVLDRPVFIVVSCGGRALHPAFGGPFSIIFPVEQYPELKGLVPESGALFFIGKISIE